jgi:hypothetical protein
MNPITKIRRECLERARRDLNAELIKLAARGTSGAARAAVVSVKLRRIVDKLHRRRRIGRG